MSRFLSWAVAVSLVCIAGVGCNKEYDLGAVKGKVTLDGAPLADATVTFTPAAGGRSAVGRTDAAGEYQLTFVDSTGALLGQHKVTVTKTATSGGTNLGEMRSDDPAYAKAAAEAASSAAYANASTEELLPAKYNTQSELVFEVKAGENIINLELKSE